MSDIVNAIKGEQMFMETVDHCTDGQGLPWFTYLVYEFMADWYRIDTRPCIGENQ